MQIATPIMLRFVELANKNRYKHVHKIRAMSF